MALICGFPKTRGAILGVPIMRTIVFGGLYWGPPTLGSYHLLYLGRVDLIEGSNHASHFWKNCCNTYSSCSCLCCLEFFRRLSIQAWQLLKMFLKMFARDSVYHGSEGIGAY